MCRVKRAIVNEMRHLAVRRTGPKAFSIAVDFESLKLGANWRQLDAKLAFIRDIYIYLSYLAFAKQISWVLSDELTMFQKSVFAPHG